MMAYRFCNMQMIPSFFLDHDIEQAKNMKLLLSVFEQMSGLKINFHKSEIFCYGQAKEFEEEYIELFGCNAGQYPFRYLGIPMHHRQLLNNDWRKVKERFEKKLTCWKAKHLSYGGRLVLLNSVLSSLPMFMMSFLRYQKGFLRNLITTNHVSSGKVVQIRKNTT